LFSDIIFFGFKNYFLALSATAVKQFKALSPTALKFFYRLRRQRLNILTPSPLALKTV
jgi:CO dehydrogenase/acetyl-CoA synthase epsilon subunit